MYVRTPSSEAEINQSPDYGGVNNLGLAIELDSNAEAFNFDEPCDYKGWPEKCPIDDSRNNRVNSRSCHQSDTFLVPSNNF